MRRLLRWLVAPAALAVLAGAALEIEAAVRSERAYRELGPVLLELERASADGPERPSIPDVRRKQHRRRNDAWAAQRLYEHAEQHPSAQAWRAASLALTWDGDREHKAALAARRAARLAPHDPGMAALEAEALDAATWAEVREVTRPVAWVGASLLMLGLMGWLARRARARRRRAWVAGASVRVVPSADGRQGPGTELLVPQGTESLVLDVFLSPPPAGRIGRCHGPTLALVLSHGQDSRTVRLTPVKDVCQDAVRVRLSEPTLREVLAHPGRWRVNAALDGRPLAQAGLLVPALRPAPAFAG